MARFIVMDSKTGQKVTKTNRKKVGRVVNELREQFPHMDIMAVDTRLVR